MRRYGRKVDEGERRVLFLFKGGRGDVINGKREELAGIWVWV